jgi:BASS family bile acid:Na+ symporter
MAAGIFLGLLLPDLADFAAPVLAPTVAAILGLSLVRLHAAELVARLRRRWLVAIALVWQLLGSAVVVWLVTWPMGLGDGLRTALVVLAAASPIMSSITLALLFRLDAALVSVVVFGATLVVPLTIGPVGVMLMGDAARLDVYEMMWRMAVIVAGAIGVAAVARLICSRAWIDSKAGEIDGIAVILLLVFAVAIMDQAAVTLRENLDLFLVVLGASFALNLFLQALTWLLFLPAGRGEAVALGLTNGNRNAGLALAGLPAAAPVEVGLIFALSQVPIYVLPLAMKPVYARLSRR